MRKFLFALFLLTYSLTHAQIEFEKGYFINNSGSKTECFIKNLDWRSNPKTFEYKINIQDTESSIGTASNVEEFGIDNISKYKKFEINIERSGNNISELTENKNPVWKEEKLFLKVLVEGDATLFSYTDGNIYKYFFKTNNSPVEQLIYIKYLNSSSENGAIGSVSENNQYKQQLFNTLKCGAFSENNFKNIKYEKSSLTKLFKEYNSCINPNTTNHFEEKTKKNLFSASITPSVNYTTITIKDPNTGTNYTTDFDGKMIFKIGAELEYTLPFNKNTWSLFINPAFQKYKNEKKYTINYNNFGFGGAYKDVTAEVEYTSLEIPIGIRHYFFLNQNSKIFINGAYVLNFFGNTKMNFDNGSRVLESSSRNNFALGIGYKFKEQFSIELRANTSCEILSDYMAWSSKYSATGLVLGYNFLKF